MERSTGSGEGVALSGNERSVGLIIRRSLSGADLKPAAVSSRLSGGTRDSGVVRYRSDIQGLRAIAVLFVLVWHASPIALPGGFVGVDVFFVISGFLMTQILTRRLSSSASSRTLRQFYAQRAKRLLPAATVTLVGTAALTWAFLPRIEWATIGLDIFAASVYVVNWRMAERSVDYLAADAVASPVQQFWSLAVEEQFYLLWPVLLLVAYRLSKRVDWNARRVVIFLSLALFTSSLMWSVYLTAVNPSRAYFVTPTRLWELVLGGMVALFALRLEAVPRIVAAILAWCGLSAILVSGIFLSEATPFPGIAALLPTVGTAMVLAWGFRSDTAGPSLVLARRPMVWVGGISYSAYLWHWPLLVVAGSLWGSSSRELPALAGLLVVMFSFGPAWLSYRFIENPMRERLGSPPERVDAIGVGLLMVIISALVGLGLAQLGGYSRTAAPVLIGTGEVRVATGSESEANTDAGAAPPAQQQYPGAAALGDAPRSSAAAVPSDTSPTFIPNPLNARDDAGPIYRRACQANEDETEVRSCVFGDPNGSKTLALAGDSHAAHWVPALDAVGKAKGWKIETYTKSSCPVIDVEVLLRGSSPYTTCSEWNRLLHDKLTDPATRPDALVVSSSMYAPAENKSASSADLVAVFGDGLAATWGSYMASGLPVVVLEDTPRPSEDVPACVLENPERLTVCGFERTEALNYASRLAQERAALQSGAAIIDLFDWICPGDMCAPVIGNVLVYRDNNHLSATYSSTLAGPLGAALASPLQ